jgi:hypothetical protein
MDMETDERSLCVDLLDEARRAEDRLAVTQDPILNVHRQGEVAAWQLVREIIRRHMECKR